MNDLKAINEFLDQKNIAVAGVSRTKHKLIKEAEAKGIRHIWLQQGSADKAVLTNIRNIQSNIISGQCILMFNEPVKGIHGFHRWLKKSFGKFPN
jgi:predicted CoA-binding protein